jgi:AICAR transformylase/IMP cyclohydrolase PurH
MTQETLSLRYGANPNQVPARLIFDANSPKIKMLNGAPGYINILDALNGWQLVHELRSALGLPAAASFKHVSPAGAAVAVPLSDVLRKASFLGDKDLSPLATAYARARGADRISSFGDFIALSDTCDVSTASLIAPEVSDGVIAPGYDADALEILQKKRGGKYLVLQIDPSYVAPEREQRQVFGVTLEQKHNDVVINRASLQPIVTEQKELPEDAQRDLIVALITLKYTQSNSVCYALDGQTIGVGAGQQSRVHCTRLAGGKADLWWLRQHPQVLDLAFREGANRAEKNNAIDGYLCDELTEPEEAFLQLNLVGNPQKLTREEKAAWLKELKGVSLG